MLSKSVRAVKFSLVFLLLCCCPAAVHAAGLTVPAALDFIGKVAETGGIAAIKGSVWDRAIQGVSGIVTASKGLESGLSGNSFSSTAIEVGAGTLGGQIGGRVLGASMFPLGPGFALGGYFAGQYVGEAAGEKIGRLAAQWLVNHPNPNLTAPLSTATAVPAQVGKPTAAFSGSQQLPFEGHWGDEDPRGGGCENSTISYTKNRSVHVSPASRETCRIQKAIAKDSETYILVKKCDDPGGDGPPEGTYVETIKINDANHISSTGRWSFKKEDEPVQKYVRCARPAQGQVVESQPAPQRPSQSRALAPGQIALQCNLSINGSMRSWNISAQITERGIEGRGVFTLRAGESIVVRQRPFTVIMNFNTGQPTGIKMQVALAPLDHWLIFDDRSSQVFLTSFNEISQRRMVGTCKGGQFKGL